MSTIPSPYPYPWHQLEKVPRAAVRAVRQALAAFKPASTWSSALSTAAQKCLGANNPVRFAMRRFRTGESSQPAYRDGAVCLLSNEDRSLMALVETEPELAHRITSLLLRQPASWVDRAQPTPSLLHSAVGAFVISCLRQGAPEAGMHLDSVGTVARTAFVSTCPAGAVLDTTVELEDTRYGASVWLHADTRPSKGPDNFCRNTLRALGDMPLSLDVVAAASAIRRVELSSVRLGDALVSGDAWTIRLVDRSPMGYVRLLPSWEATGLWGQLDPNGGIALLPTRSTIMQEPNAVKPAVFLEECHGMDDPVVDVLGDAPVVVRVEIGTVTMTARQWAALQSGDVITTGHAIGERARLRVGGIEVARGTLVDVEGEIGVRITELLTETTSVTENT